MPECRPHRLHAGARDIVERILRRKRPARCLTVRTECHGLRVLRTKRLDDFCPENACSAHLCDFHKVILADCPEEREPLGKVIDLQPCLDARTDVLKTVGKRIAKLDICRCARFLHMVAGNRDAVELRHILCRVFKDIADDAHGHIRGINIGVANHELFQDIVLDRARHDGLVDTLLNTRLNEEGENRKNRAVHRHRDGHLIERDAREQNVHIQHGADRDTRLADIAQDTWVIRIIAAVRRQIKRNGKSLLPCSQVAAVEGIGLLRSGKPSVLTNCPRTEDIHRGVRAAQARRNATGKIQVVHVLVFFVIVKGLYGNVLHRAACELIEVLSRLFLKNLAPLSIRMCWGFR